MSTLETARRAALATFARCATKNGLYASAPPEGYTMVFARDATITCLGARFEPFPLIRQQFAKSLQTLGTHQSKTGQIPNAVDRWDTHRPPYDSFATIDSTCWWLIGLKTHATHYRDSTLLKRFAPRIEAAFFWLACQDTGEDGMPEQHPTSDWQDAFPHKYGHTINTQALYYHALRLFGRSKPAKQVLLAANGRLREDWSLWSDDLGYYRPWRWKNHDQYRETEDWFDTSGNLLAILSGLATDSQADSILDHIEQHHIAKPFPCHAIDPPLIPSSPAWHDYYDACAARMPNEYLNGGICIEVFTCCSYRIYFFSVIEANI
jgi:hypothetical protein